jgi:hypothetical protein
MQMKSGRRLKNDKAESSILNFDNIKISIDEDSILDSLEKSPVNLKYGSPALWLNRRSGNSAKVIKYDKPLFNKLTKVDKSPFNLPKIQQKIVVSDKLSYRNERKKGDPEINNLFKSSSKKNLAANFAKFSNIRIQESVFEKNDEEIVYFVNLER